MTYTVLTYIFNRYEAVHEIGRKDPDAEYILVTDDPTLKSDTWTIVYDASLDDLSPFDKCYIVRFHPFRYAHTDIVVRLDASISVLKPLAPIVSAFVDGGFDRCLMIHPLRDNIPDEYEAWVTQRGYPPDQAEKCLGFIESLGCDLSKKGLFQCGFEIVRNSSVNAWINEITYLLLRALGTDGKIERIDQTVFTLVANNLFSDRLKVMPVGEDLITDGRMMQMCYHGTLRKVPKKENTIMPVMFGKPCELSKPTQI